MIGKIDFTGVEEFFKISEILERDSDPTEEQWEKLFITPGYKELTKSEFSKEFFIKSFNIAFKPSNKIKLEEAINSSQGISRFLQHYVSVKNNKSKILDKIEELKSTDFQDRIIQYVSKFLPSNKIENYPTISFVVFDNDARGYSIVIMDILFSLCLGETLPLVLAHEYHHYYRNRLLEFDLDSLDSVDVHLVSAVNQIHAEGIADLIDKEQWLKEKIKGTEYEMYAQKYWQYVQQSPEIIKQMNGILIKIANSSDEAEELGKEFERLSPMSGHTLGYFIAKTILDEMGIEAVISDLGNPFMFIRKYNEAVIAKDKMEMSFSQEAMNLLNELERKYITGTVRTGILSLTKN